MNDLFALNSKIESDCNSCAAKGCNSCSSSDSDSGTNSPTLFTRRNFGRTVLAASAGAFLQAAVSPPKLLKLSSQEQTQQLPDFRRILLL